MRTLPIRQTLHPGVLRVVDLALPPFFPIRRDLSYISGQIDLMREIVVDDPFVPAELKPVEIHFHTGQKSGSWLIGRRRRVESQPARTRKISFDPAMCVAGPH